MSIDRSYFEKYKNREFIANSIAQRILLSPEIKTENTTPSPSDGFLAIKVERKKEEQDNQLQVEVTSDEKFESKQPVQSFDSFNNIQKIILKYNSPENNDNQQKNSDLSKSQHIFSDAILELNLLADREKGIHSEYIFINKDISNNPNEKSEVRQTQAIDAQDGSQIRVLYRDTTRKDLNPTETPYANWAIMGLNYIHAAVKLLEIVYGIDNFDKSQIKNMALAFMENMKVSSHPQETLGRMIHSILIPFVIESHKNKKLLSSEDIEEQLAQIRDFNNFDQPTFVVATRSKIDVVKNEHKAIHGDSIDHLDIDVPMTGGLTEKQRNQYQAILNNDQNNLPKWYNKQPPHIKKLIKHHAHDILAGRMISNQLRKKLAGVRNGGHEFIYAKSQKTNLQPKCIFEAYHSSNPAHEHTDTQADKENIRQLGQLMGAEHVVLCDLTSNVPIIGEGEIPYLTKGVNPRTERAIEAVETENKKSTEEKKAIDKKEDEQVKPADINKVEDKKTTDEKEGTKEKPKSVSPVTSFHHSKLPAHLHRAYLSNKYDGVDFIREQADYFSTYLDGNKNVPLPQTIKNELDKAAKSNIEIENLKKLIREYDKIRKLLGRSLLDEENNNLILASIAAELVFCVNQLCNSSNYLALDEFCKSGKDRGGLLRLMMNIDATTRFITGGELDLAQRDAVAESLTKSNQVGAQAGYIGNALGASGVLESVKYALPAYLKKEGMSPISAKTAAFNKKVPVNPDIPYYKKSKFWFKWLLRLGGVLLGGALCATGIGAVVGVPVIATSITIGTVGFGATMVCGAYIGKKSKRKKSFYKNPYFWLGLVGVLAGLGLCATGFGAVIGVPILVGSIASVGSSVLAAIGTIVAGVGGIVGITSTVRAYNAASNKKSSMTFAMLGMAGLGAVLCMTGIGAIIGVPLIAATVSMAIASTSGALIAGSTLLSSTAREENTPFYKKPRFWLALGATLVGLALCATGVGAAAGLPLIAASTIMYASTAAIGMGSIMMAAPILTSKTTSKITKVFTVLGAIVGIGLCLTGIGAIAGYPLLKTLGFLGQSGANLVYTTTTSTGIPALVTASAVASVTASGGAAAVVAAKKVGAQPKIEKVTEVPTPKLSKEERRDMEIAAYGKDQITALIALKKTPEREVGRRRSSDAAILSDLKTANNLGGFSRSITSADLKPVSGPIPTILNASSLSSPSLFPPVSEKKPLPDSEKKPLPDSEAPDPERYRLAIPVTNKTQT